MRKSLLLAVFVLGACGGGDSGSGIEGSKQLKDLTPDEQTKECMYIVDVEGGPGHQTMCGDVTFETHTVQECVDLLNGVAMAGTCTATIDQSEACAEALGDNPCEGGGAACAPILDPSCSPQ